MYKKYIKRIIDVLLSLLGIILTSPILILTSILIKLDSKGPIIFKQDRLGLNGKVFKIYKFRSMCNNAEKQGSGQYSFKGDPRVTKVGKFIRATSIDELPQFFNILKGDMSLIGFRPPLTYHPFPYSEYDDEQKDMFKLKPGVTGWAQVNGRKEVKWDNRIKMNVWYAENISFLLDLKIFFLTILKVIKNENNENTIITVGEHKEDEKS